LRQRWFPDIFPETIGKEVTLSKASKASLTRHRRRMKEDGLVRVEVKVKKQDAALVRRVAKVLGDPVRGKEARAMLRQRLAPPPSQDLKALLAAAPLEGVDLERSREVGRRIDL
jgi:hypothetical protein